MTRLAALALLLGACAGPRASLEIYEVAGDAVAPGRTEGDPPPAGWKDIEYRPTIELGGPGDPPTVFVDLVRADSLWTAADILGAEAIESAPDVWEIELTPTEPALLRWREAASRSRLLALLDGCEVNVEEAPRPGRLRVSGVFGDDAAGARRLAERIHN